MRSLAHDSVSGLTGSNQVWRRRVWPHRFSRTGEELDGHPCAHPHGRPTAPPPPPRPCRPPPPTAPADARNLVMAAVSDWNVPVDPHVAALLTSELVTNAIRHEKGDTIKLFVTSSCGHLRVYVHDTSRSAP